MISDAFLDELRARVSLSTLIGRTVKLQRAAGEWKACCPFHQEKTASFYVNDPKAFYHCFGCGVHGDAIRWMTEQRGMQFLDAVRELAESVGLEVPAIERGQVESRVRDGSRHATMTRTAEWFAATLASPDGAGARSYLAGRRVTPELAKRFGIGVAPKSRDAWRAGLPDDAPAELIACGVLIEPDDGGEPYSRFRGRLIFPIRDARGRIVSFGGRILGNGEPKYLNGPETSLFDKGSTLFNLDQAAPAARKAGRLLVVEGYMDVIGLARAGIAEAVAPMGTALTQPQIGRLWKVVDVPTICFDGDQAGRRAAVKAAVRALPGLTPGRSLRFALLPEGNDPDDLARAGGAAAVDAAIDRALPLHELLWSHEYFAAPLDTPEARAGLAVRLQAHADAIEDPDVRREYASLFRERMFPARRRYRPTAPDAPAPLGGAASPDTVRRKQMVAMLKGLAAFPDVLTEEAERVGAIPVPDATCARAFDMLLKSAHDGSTIDVGSIAAMFPEESGYRGLWRAFNRPTTTPAEREAARAGLVETITWFLEPPPGEFYAHLHGEWAKLIANPEASPEEVDQAWNELVAERRWLDDQHAAREEQYTPPAPVEPYLPLADG